MAWNKFDNKPLSGSDKIKLYTACVGISIAISIGVVFHPFLYSTEYLQFEAKRDVIFAMKNLNSPIRTYSTELNLVEIKPLGNDCFYVFAVSKFADTGFVIQDTCSFED